MLFEFLAEHFQNVSLLTFALPLIATVLVVLLKRKHRNLPPGPPGIPVFGNLFQLDGVNICEEFQKYRKQYGDIFSIRMGSCPIIVINGYENLKEVFQRRGDEFYHRPNNYVNTIVLEHEGIGSSNGQNWKAQRSFGTAGLRHFGVGRRNIEIPIREECERLIEEVEKMEEKSFDIHDTIQNAVSNIVCAISFGRRYEYEDHKFVELGEMLDTFMALLSQVGKINAFPFMRHFPFDLFGQRRAREIYKKILDYMQKKINEHKKTLIEDDPRDIIDLYLIEMKKLSPDSESYFDEYKLCHVLAQFFIAGTETSTNIIRWSIIHLLHNPDIQKKLNDEINTVLGDNAPAMKDRINMNYMAAFIEEVQRFSIVAPLAFEHCATEDNTINGYFIPKDVVLTPNLYSVAFDEDIFPDPYKFKPERFLDGNGKFHQPEKNIPFSIGRRICVGESLAKTEIFLFLSSLLQHFKFVEGDDGMPTFAEHFGLTRAPVSYTIKALLRK